MSAFPNSSSEPKPLVSRTLHWWIVLTAAMTFVLLGAGGLVTSHGVGMAVPDWPNTYGYNMFFFPFSRWVGGVFYEHSHRLIASMVGLMTAIMAVWLFGRRARRFLRAVGPALLAAAALTGVVTPARWSDAVVVGATGAAALASSFVWPRSVPAPKWLRRLGLLAFAAVVLQGVLGGLRVVLYMDQIGILHAMLAQLFFTLTCALAVVTSRWWAIHLQGEEATARASVRSNGRLGGGLKDPKGAFGSKLLRTKVRAPVGTVLIATALIFMQLILGAAMRHQHAGLAIPDFPLAYGKLWPATDPASVAHYNQQRLEVVAANPITAFQVILQMVHRLVAVGIVAAIGVCAWQWRACRPGNAGRRLAYAWLCLVLIQVLMGAATIWSNKAADLATAHVMVGALSLAVGGILSVVTLRDSALADERTFLQHAPGGAQLSLNPSPAVAPGA